MSKRVQGVESCIGCGEAVVMRRIYSQKEADEALCERCKRAKRDARKDHWAATAKPIPERPRSCSDCNMTGTNAAGKPCFCDGKGY
jgi:hypothetical protein